MADPAGVTPPLMSLSRRRFLAAIAGSFLAAPVVAEAQQAKRSMDWDSGKYPAHGPRGSVSGARSSRKCGARPIECSCDGPRPDRLSRPRSAPDIRRGHAGRPWAQADRCTV